MSELRNPHDLFFRETFSQLEVARDFMTNYLPAEVSAVLDLNTLELQKDSFIDAELREHFSDLLYRVQLRDCNEANVYLLLEHKSSPDVQVAFQLLRYMVRYWERAQREKVKPLPPVIPIVVYHGREKWQIPENFAGLFEGPESLWPYWPDFRYELHDFSKYSDKDVRGGIILRVVSLLLMGIFDPQLPKRLPGIFHLLNELDDEQSVLELLEKTLRYLSATVRDIGDKTIQAALKEAFKDEGGSIMAGFVEKWIEIGKQEGQQALQNAILDLLMVRFGITPESIGEELTNVTDLELLQKLHYQAATAESITAFEDYLTALDT